MFPTFPAKFNVVVVPEHIVAFPVIVPATDVGEIIIAPETVLETFGKQVPPITQ